MGYTQDLPYLNPCTKHRLPKFFCQVSVGDVHKARKRGAYNERAGLPGLERFGKDLFCGRVVCTIFGGSLSGSCCFLLFWKERRIVYYGLGGRIVAWFWRPVELCSF